MDDGNKKISTTDIVEIFAKPLFQFGFFIDNVFAGNGVKFFDFQFARHGTFVFGSGVEMTCTSRRF